MAYDRPFGWRSLSLREYPEGVVRAVLTRVDYTTRRVVHEDVCSMIGDFKSDLEVAELFAAAAWYHLSMRAPESLREPREAVTGVGGAVLPLAPSAPAGG